MTCRAGCVILGMMSDPGEQKKDGGESAEGVPHRPTDSWEEIDSGWGDLEPPAPPPVPADKPSQVVTARADTLIDGGLAAPDMLPHGEAPTLVEPNELGAEVSRRSTAKTIIGIGAVDDEGDVEDEATAPELPEMGSADTLPLTALSSEEARLPPAAPDPALAEVDTSENPDPTVTTQALESMDTSEAPDPAATTQALESMDTCEAPDPAATTQALESMDTSESPDPAVEREAVTQPMDREASAAGPPSPPPAPTPERAVSPPPPAPQAPPAMPAQVMPQDFGTTLQPTPRPAGPSNLQLIILWVMALTALGVALSLWLGG